jgi:hypothetical protein
MNGRFIDPAECQGWQGPSNAANREVAATLARYLLILRDQAGFVLPEVCDCSETVHLQFEDEVLVIEGIADELRIAWNELRERQCAFSIATKHDNKFGPGHVALSVTPAARAPTVWSQRKRAA